jgi:hypothetical protein
MLAARLSGAGDVTRFIKIIGFALRYMTIQAACQWESMPWEQILQELRLGRVVSEVLWASSLDRLLS